jgi:hypothetical protein
MLMSNLSIGMNGSMPDCRRASAGGYYFNVENRLPDLPDRYKGKKITVFTLAGSSLNIDLMIIHLSGLFQFSGKPIVQKFNAAIEKYFNNN